MKSRDYLCQRHVASGKLRFNNFTYAVFFKKLTQKQRKILKVLLLAHLHTLFTQIFQNITKNNRTISFVEHYVMDNKIIEFLINEILKTEEYTLEGIAYHTRVPFDIIFDAACGNNSQLTITLWTRIVQMYAQVKPDAAKILLQYLLEIEDENRPSLSVLLSLI